MYIFHKHTLMLYIDPYTYIVRRRYLVLKSRVHWQNSRGFGPIYKGVVECDGTVCLTPPPPPLSLGVCVSVCLSSLSERERRAGRLRLRLHLGRARQRAAADLSAGSDQRPGGEGKRALNAEVRISPSRGHPGSRDRHPLCLR